MKVVILAGGLGTRLAEETDVRPKPMVQIGDQPILWHILKHYSHFGHSEFYIALGYKGEYIKRYFLDYYALNGSMTVDISREAVRVHERDTENWVVHLMDTGGATQTGGRLKRLQPALESETFMMTYGDGIADVDLDAVVAFHKSHGKLATITAIQPPSRFGGIIFDGDDVAAFAEKPPNAETWVNGGFMVLEPGVFDYLLDDQTSFETDALQRLAADGQLVAYRHPGFWQCMDTLRDKRYLEDLWQSGKAPWRVF